MEFVDVTLFDRLFNLIYDEKINMRLQPSNLMEERLLNWSKINRK